MLTVKHVSLSGHQSISTGEKVYYDPAVGENKEFPAGQVTTYTGPEMGDHYSDGIIYVMNDSGSTVAHYNLNAGRTIDD